MGSEGGGPLYRGSLVEPGGGSFVGGLKVMKGRLWE